MWYPQTFHTLMEATGAGQSATHSWLKALESAGIIYRFGRLRPRSGKAGCHAIIWAMQPKPFHFENSSKRYSFEELSSLQKGSTNV